MRDHADPKSQGDGRSSRLKFRSACDSCAASKVRCQKQQPVCSRCEQLDLECIYGRSQRKGKPASYATKAAQAETAQQQLWQLPDSYDAYFDLESLTNATSATDTSGNITPNEQQHRLGFSEPCQSFSFADLLEPAQAGLDDQLTREVMSCLEWRSKANPLFSAPPTKPLTPRSVTADMNIDITELSSPIMKTSPSETCISQALTTLSSLYQLIGPNQGHDTTGARLASANDVSSSYPSGDVVLLTTRRATRTLSRLLACSCPFCYNDTNLPFLLSITAAKCLSWYQVLYLSNIRGIPDPASQDRDLMHSPSDNSSSLLGQAESAAAAYMMPLGVGAFSLPRATEMRMKAQMLLCELQPLSQACNALGGKARSEEGRGVRRLSDGFTELLQRDLGELRRNLESICRQLS